LFAFLDSIAEHDAGTGNDYRVLRIGEHLCRLVDLVLIARLPARKDRLRNFDVDDLAEHVARHVELDRGRVLAGALEAASQGFDHAAGMGQGFLVTGDFLEGRQLAGFLKTAQPLGLGGRLGSNHDHRGVVPIGGRDGRDEVGDARTILGNTNSNLAASSRIAIGHVSGALFVRDIDKANAGSGKDVQTRHKGRSDDTKGDFGALDAKRFHERLMRCHFH